MNLKDRLRNQLTTTRQTTLQLLEAFNTPEEWVHQVHPTANHALWFLGHMGLTDNFMIAMLSADKKVERPDLSEQFGMGSQPTANAADYPSVDEVRQFMDERRAALLECLDAMTEEDLAQPMPEGAPDFMTDIASAFEMITWHEGVHVGQLTVARRSLGHAPLFQPPAEE